MYNPSLRVPHSGASLRYANSGSYMLRTLLGSPNKSPLLWQDGIKSIFPRAKRLSRESLPVVKSGELFGFGTVGEGDRDGLYGRKEFKEKSGGDVC